ncbi:peptidoglycan-associated lipoprotein Pal [Hydrogenophaga aromaticivorans]|uniref:Peptidoglycan-associated lipoprotein n=1 Tax=Hydrogenophaga aromaticivorans TaxID=2610898 RepID=A0A7Y8GVC0_9BURK|nr:peptidoglycan-associated lipoprotein Pal [Hydrogenophaga aromaticivorans]MBQ0918590.1 peptidoglycan-associated lipoprotein Pal [Hydrogenophaga aromaticivorans]NWF44814.1 peptidoglycan-associated lipoprotein Pal [Hydrogenophaga aromaticivorans]
MNNKFQPAPSSVQRGNRVWLNRFAGLLVVASLAACGSSVKLDDVPVEDRTGGAAGQAGQGGAGSGVDPRGVSGVEVPSMDSQQPEAMARVVYFDYDSFEVRGEYAATLEANARYLKANSSRKIALEGHTDERGGREYNLALGQKRAEAVRRSLSLMGVSESQMEPVSFGEEKPAALGMDEASYAKNRRVELTYR